MAASGGEGLVGGKEQQLGRIRAGVLPVSVRDKAWDGRPTGAILKLLAAKFRAARADVSLLGGEFAPLKRVRIRLPAKLPAALSKALAALLRAPATLREP